MKTKGNKRRSRRQKCLVPVDAKKGTAFADVQAVDIGRGGMGFVSNKAISIDEKIVVELELKSDNEVPVLMEGQIKWIQKQPQSGNYRIGVQFTGALAKESETQLKEYLNSGAK